MYFIKDKLVPNSINESTKILLKNFIVNFAKYTSIFLGYPLDPVQMMDTKLVYMMDEFNSHFKLTKEVESKIDKLIEDLDKNNKELSVLDIQEIDKFIHLKYQLKNMNKYNIFRKRIFDKQSKYSIYKFFYRMIIDNDWELLKQIDAYTIPQLICKNKYIVFISFDEYEIKKIFTLAIDNMFYSDTKVELLEIPFKNKINQSEFKKNN